MRKWFALVAILLLVALYFFLRSPKNAASPAGKAATRAASGASAANSVTPPNNSGNVPPIASPDQGVASSAPPANLAAHSAAVPPPDAPTALPPAVVLENVSHAIHEYGAMFGGNPVGTNPEITSALNGKNPKQLNFINAQAGMRINEKGELIDSWGTPFFFHQLSGTLMEIHSAGLDKIMWTPDDLVIR